MGLTPPPMPQRTSDPETDQMLYNLCKRELELALERNPFTGASMRRRHQVKLTPEEKRIIHEADMAVLGVSFEDWRRKERMKLVIATLAIAGIVLASVLL